MIFVTEEAVIRMSKVFVVSEIYVSYNRIQAKHLYPYVHELSKKMCCDMFIGQALVLHLYGVSCIL